MTGLQGAGDAPKSGAPETGEARLKRLTMRSWRRGTREMDLILGPFADARLAAMDAEALALYDALLGENDQDLYPWVTGKLPAPAQYGRLLADISGFSLGRLAPKGQRDR